MKHFPYPIIIMLIGCLFTNCSKEDNENNPPPSSGNDLVNVARGQDDLSIFVEALDKTDLTHMLRDAPYTVFAPTNAAFDEYFHNLQVQGVDGWIQNFEIDVVRNILLYHMIKGPGIEAEQVTTSFVHTASLNRKQYPLSLYTSRTDTLISLNGGTAKVTGMNIRADNGIIHKTDGVLALPTLKLLLEVHPGYSHLQAALQAASGSLLTVVNQENENFSFFAPVNQAFAEFYKDNPALSNFESFLQYYSANELRDLLLYHLLNNSLRSADLSNRTYSTALTGYSFAIDKGSEGTISITDNTGKKADVLVTNITAVNGIIHNIDYVLSPG